jgi:hypothetical protein
MMATEAQMLCDLGNTLLAPQPFRVDLGVATNDDGVVVGVVTRRTASTSLTVYPTADQLDAEAKMLTALAARVRESGSQIITPHPAVIQALQQKLNGR